MSRINRIRESIVAKALSTDGLWESGQTKRIGAEEMLEEGKLGQHLWRQTEARRRQIVAKLFDISNREFQD